MSFTSLNTQGEPRVRRRDRLRSFAQATTLSIKKEINKYYEPVTPPRARSILSINSNDPISNGMKRTETDELEDMLEDAPEVIQPQCLVFPTYACQVSDNHWKIHLAGWAFAKPGSSRLDRWLLGNIVIVLFLFAYL